MAETHTTPEPADAESIGADPTPADPTVRTLPLMPVPGGVVYPEMVVTVALESDESQAAAAAATDDLIVLVPRIEDRYVGIGAIARIENRGTLRNGLPALTIRATDRAAIGVGVIGTGATLWVEATPLEVATSGRTPELADRYRDVATRLLERLGGGRISAALPDNDDPSALADTIAYWPELSLDQRVELLETVDEVTA